ncbi:MAG: hypothetical protein M0R46_08545 [Candidatus Muirbacterium halophilum]|nr:hypothetical protein [Candidatus Muirbacterium halophilum]MCK9475953.1 hypothetical protein [Candidatus Muirbacterium halophilum]
MRFLNILKNMINMIIKHKAWFFAPILIFFALISILVFYIGPTAIMAFIYAGI